MQEIRTLVHNKVFVVEFVVNLKELRMRFVFVNRVLDQIRAYKEKMRWAFIKRGLPDAVIAHIDDQREYIKEEEVIRRAREYRANVPRGDTICPHCGAGNDRVWCWRCGKKVRYRYMPPVFHKYGAKLISQGQVERIRNEYIGQKGIDLLQPSRHYDKSRREWYTNPDYVKHYGDPFANKKDK